MEDFTTAKREAEIEHTYKGSYMLTIGDYQCGWHSHETWEFHLQLAGANDYHIGDKIYKPSTGDLLITPPGIRHQMQNQQITLPYECYVLYFPNSFLYSLEEGGTNLLASYQQYFSQGDYLLHFSGNSLAFLNGLLNGMVNSDRSEEFRLSMSETLIYYILSRFKKKPAGKEALSENQIISVVVQYINEHFTEPLSLDSICDTLYISKSYLVRYFKANTSMTVYEYILRKRVDMAKQLLIQGVSAIDAAEQCGFSDYSNFYRVFTAKAGCTPRRFMEENTVSEAVGK